MLDYPEKNAVQSAIFTNDEISLSRANVKAETDIKEIEYKGSFFGFEMMVLSKGIANQILSNPKTPQYVKNRLLPYVQTLYTESDFEAIQKAVNYTVVRWIKMEKNWNNTLDTLNRWKYVKNMMEEYNIEFPNKNFNVKSFDRMKEEIITILFN